MLKWDLSSSATMSERENSIRYNTDIKVHESAANMHAVLSGSTSPASRRLILALMFVRSTESLLRQPSGRRLEVSVVVQKNVGVEFAVSCQFFKRVGGGREDVEHARVFVIDCGARPPLGFAWPAPVLDTVRPDSDTSPAVRLQDVGPIGSRVEVITGAVTTTRGYWSMCRSRFWVFPLIQLASRLLQHISFGG